MADDLFQASLDRSSRTTLDPFKVKVQPTKDKPKGTKLPFVPLKGPNGEAPAAPPAPNVFLQVWEVDTFEKAKHGRGKRKKDEEEKPKETNDLLVEVPGYLLQTGKREFEFRVLGAPVFGSGDPLGWLTLALRDQDGKPWPAADKDLIVPIVGEGEDEVDLGCVLSDAAGKKEHESAWKGGPIVHATNLTHILGSQLEEGGLTLGFWADLLSRAEKEELQEARREISKAPNAEAKRELMKGKYKHLYTGLDSANNNDTFRSAGEEFARRLHSVGVRDGRLALMSTPFKSTGELLSAVKEIRAKVEEHFVKKFLPGKEPPKVKRLAIFTHGWSTGIKGGPGHHNYEKMKQELADFAEKLAPHCTQDLLVTLFACLTAGGAEDFGDAPAEGPRKHSYAGEGSFADVMCRKLIEKGLADAAVWGHTTAGHTYGNPMLRAFSRDGSADIVWMVKGKPPAQKNERKKLAGKFVSANRDKDKEVMLASCVHPKGKISEVGSC